MSIFDAFARFLRLDDYPNQPGIVKFPETEAEQVERYMYEALAYEEVQRAGVPAAAQPALVATVIINGETYGVFKKE